MDTSWCVQADYNVSDQSRLRLELELHQKEVFPRVREQNKCSKVDLWSSLTKSCTSILPAFSTRNHSNEFLNIYDNPQNQNASLPWRPCYPLMMSLTIIFLEWHRDLCKIADMSQSMSRNYSQPWKSFSEKANDENAMQNMTYLFMFYQYRHEQV